MMAPRLTIATRDAGTIYVAEPRQPVTKANVCVAIRPEKVKLSRRGPVTDADNARAINRLDGIVTDVSYLGGLTTYKVKLDSGAVVRSSMANTARLDIDAYQASQRVVAWFSARRLRGAGAMSARRIFARPARIAAIAPYLWMVLFFLVPFGFVLKISLSQTAIAQPPYVPVFDLTLGLAALKAAFAELSLDNFRLLVTDNLYICPICAASWSPRSRPRSFCLIGYPIAYGMARLPLKWQGIAMMLVIVPFWTSFLIRIYAWINILQHDGLLNKILLALHLVSTPVVWLSTDSAMYLGIVYSYLPFMILPLYATLAKIEPALLEAAGDLGASPRQAFWLVTFPLSLPGVGAGALLCFIPIVGEFVIPDLLAGSNSLMIGQTLWLEFFTNKDWPVASAAAVVLLSLLVAPLALYDRLQRRQLEAGR